MADQGWLDHAFLDQGPACHWIIDPGHVFQAVYGDSSHLLGKPAADLKGQPLAAVFSRHVAEAWKARLDRVFAGEIVRLRERRGSLNWFIALFPIRRRNRIVYAGATAREMTPWGTAEQELRHTVLSALKAQESERNKASRFLHDSVGQNLTALGLQLDLIRMDLETTQPESSARLAEVQKMLETMMEQVREYIYELNPSIVERAGLWTALDRLIGRVRSHFGGTVRLLADSPFTIDPKIAIPLYHIAQEAVENAVQHASCSTIEIALKSTRKGPILEVRDNGCGFDPEDVLRSRRGLGLLSMEHYAAEAGVALTVSSKRDAGTKVRAAAGVS